MKLNFKQLPTMTAGYYEEYVSGIQKYYTDLIINESAREAVRALMDDYDHDIITEEFRDKILIKLVEFRPEPLPPPTPKKKTTKHKKTV